MTVPTPFVAADIGGTHARFAEVNVGKDGRPVVASPVVLATGDFPTFEAAWKEACARFDFQPRALGLAVAGPVADGRAQLTNGQWEFDRQALERALDFERVEVLNDLAAVAHGVARLADDSFRMLKPGAVRIEDARSIGVVGVGTGFGFARLERVGGRAKVVPTEAGHAGFSPSNQFDAQLAVSLRRHFERISVERLVSGDALCAFVEAVDPSSPPADPVELWTDGLSGANGVAATAIDRFCGTLGSVLGDMALAQGLETLVLVGGVVERLVPRLAQTDFLDRFLDKAPMSGRLEGVGLCTPTYSNPGLFGAAAGLLYMDQHLDGHVTRQADRSPP